MDLVRFLRQSSVVVVAGKGGVGKTTVTAALARLAADSGLSVLVVDLEGKAGVPAAFGRGGSLAYEEVTLHRAGAGRAAGGGTAGTTGDAASGAGDAASATGGAAGGAWRRPGGPGDGTTSHGARGVADDGVGSPVPPGTVRARRITPDDALLEYLADHGMRRVSKRLVASGVLDVVATAIPGIRDILVLGKVKQLERAGMADLVLVDAPATGHAMTFLSSARGLLDAARSGPVRSQAAEVVELLSDPDRCQVVLVTLPEEMPVNEVIEAAYQLEDRIGVALGPVVVNACMADRSGLDLDPQAAAEAAGVPLPGDQQQALAAAARFRRRRYLLQQEQLDRLADELPLAQLRLPAVPGSAIGPEQLTVLADALGDAVASLPEPAVGRGAGAASAGATGAADGGGPASPGGGSR